ncbi:MAG: mcrA [Gemmatimonadetes bacterium]|jgi:hypothetical protein|nr:mcrA [Gemmatimonadota bacterium]
MSTPNPRSTPLALLVPATFDARLRFLPRAAGGLAALLLTLAIAGQLLLATRLRDVGRTLHLGDGSAVSAVESAVGLQLAVTWVLLLGGGASVILLLTLGRATASSIATSVDHARRAVDAMASGTTTLPLGDAEGGAMGELHASLRRLAHQTRVNAETAQALANGAFRRAATSRRPEDPTGIALARLTRNMETMATAAQRIARGDLGVRVAPQSGDDAFGEACSAMVRRVKGVLREVDETRAALSGTIAALRADAESLAAAAGGEADNLRAALDQVTFLALQADADAGRAAALADSASAGEQAAREGAVQLDRSCSAMQTVLQRSGVVQRLARDAGLLALKRSTDLPSTEQEVRALAREASIVAAELQRLAVDSSESSHASGIAIGRVMIAARNGSSIARDVEDMTRSRAARLREIDAALVMAEHAAVHNAATARQLTARVHALTSQARRLDGVLRRFGKSDSALASTIVVAPLADARIAASGYPTPPHACLAFPPLRMLAARG